MQTTKPSPSPSAPCSAFFIDVHSLIPHTKMHTRDKTTPANGDPESSLPKAGSTTPEAARMTTSARQLNRKTPQANLWQTVFGVISKNRPLRRDLTAKGRIPAMKGRWRLASHGLRLLFSSILPSPSRNAEKAILQAVENWKAETKLQYDTWRSHPELDRWGPAGRPADHVVKSGKPLVNRGCLNSLPNAHGQPPAH